MLVVSCDTENSSTPDATETASRAAASEVTTPRPAPLGAHRPEELVAAATEVVGFLRGQVPLARIRLADTVVLQLSPEGGGTRRAVAREMLRSPSSWKVRPNRPSPRPIDYSFVPHPRLTILTTRVGRHLNCMESDLSSRSAELAPLPHVGTMLSPTGQNSCMQTWNVTLVFDPVAKPPVLVAAVYDQWEW